MHLMKCGKCGVEKERLENISDGKGGIKQVCLACYNKDKFGETLKLKVPAELVFATKISKMGKQRIINVPSKLKPLIDFDAEYIVMLKKVK